MDEVGFADIEAGAAVLALVAQIESAAAALANLGHETLPASVLATLSLRNESAGSVECHAVATVASLDRTGWVAAHQGLRSVPGWVAHERKTRRATVERALMLGAAMRATPATFTAWRTGRISTEHVSLLVLAASGRRKTVFAEHEADLVDAAVRFCFEDFVVIVRHWMGLADPNGAAAESQAAIDARSWKCSETMGIWKIDAATRARYGDAASIMDKLPRNAEQRRADATLAMARRSRVADHTPVHPAAIIHIEADAATVEAAARRIADPDAPVTVAPQGRCRMENGPVLSLDDLIELLLVSRVEMVVRDLRTRRVDLGDAQRFFTAAAREAIIRRDGRCTFPGCGLPAQRCDIDHLVAWSTAAAPTKPTATPCAATTTAANTSAGPPPNTTRTPTKSAGPGTAHHPTIAAPTHEAPTTGQARTTGRTWSPGGLVIDRRHIEARTITGKRRSPHDLTGRVAPRRPHRRALKPPAARFDKGAPRCRR